jgi:hypothetical protein
VTKKVVSVFVLFFVPLVTTFSFVRKNSERIFFGLKSFVGTSNQDFLLVSLAVIDIMLIILLKIILQIYYNLTVQGFFFCCKLTKNNEMQRDKQFFDLILEEQERQIHGLELIAEEMRSWKQQLVCFDQQICGRISWKDTTEVVK